jgi:hypothetical protein
MMPRPTDKGKAALLTQGGSGRNWSAGSGSVSIGHYGMGDKQCQYPVHGRVKGDTWSKTVRRSQHMLRKPPAWAVDAADLDRATRCGVRWLELYEAEQGVTYRVVLETLRQRGKVFDRGFGQQVLLPLGYWQTGAPVAPPPDEPRQGVLW